MSLPSVLFRLRRILIWTLHLALVPAGYYVAFMLRFDGVVPAQFQHYFWDTVLYLLIIRLATFGGFGLFHGWWRHVGGHACVRSLSGSLVMRWAG